MSLSIPKFILNAFAKNGLKNAIPESANQVTGDAGYIEGFPPVTFIPKIAGGIPPKGRDFNGIFYDMSAALQYAQSGVAFPFDAEFAGAIGGYAEGAIVSDISNSTLWVNNSANNTLPPSAGNGWSNFAYDNPTEALRGIPLVSTQSETNAGTDDAKFVTPKKLRFGFAASLNQNGYIVFPSWLGGLIIQWGYSINIADSATTTTLPIAFPEAFFGGIVSVQVDSGVGVNRPFSALYPLNLSTFNLRSYYNLSGISNFWICLGK